MSRMSVCLAEISQIYSFKKSTRGGPGGGADTPTIICGQKKGRAKREKKGRKRGGSRNSEEFVRGSERI